MPRGQTLVLPKPHPEPARGLTRLSLCSHPACAMGGRRLARVLRRELASAGLRVDLPAAPTLCGGRCEHGPYLGLRELGLFYAGVRPGEAAELVAETVLAGRLLFHRLRLEPYTVTDSRMAYERESGVMVLMEPDMCLVKAAAYLLDFHGRESCGKCVPCRLGVLRMWRLLDKMERGGASPGDIAELGAVARVMAQGSYCEFGPKAAAPVLLLWDQGRDLLEAHLEHGCPRPDAPGLGPPGGPQP
jgi:(2Fe-2S) ferredoxin